MNQQSKAVYSSINCDIIPKTVAVSNMRVLFNEDETPGGNNSSQFIAKTDSVAQAMLTHFLRFAMLICVSVYRRYETRVPHNFHTALKCSWWPDILMSSRMPTVKCSWQWSSETSQLVPKKARSSDSHLIRGTNVSTGCIQQVLDGWARVLSGREVVVRVCPVYMLLLLFLLASETNCKWEHC